MNIKIASIGAMASNIPQAKLEALEQADTYQYHIELFDKDSGALKCRYGLDINFAERPVQNCFAEFKKDANYRLKVDPSRQTITFALKPRDIREGD